MECVHEHGIQLFDGVEMSMTLMKILRKHFGIHLRSILRFPPLQKFEIWIHLYSYLTTDLDQGSCADYFVTDTHGFLDGKKGEVFQSFEILKEMKQMGVSMEKVVLDLNCVRNYDGLDKRREKIELMYEFGCAGLSYTNFPQDYPTETKNDMITLAYHHPFA